MGITWLLIDNQNSGLQS